MTITRRSLTISLILVTLAGAIVIWLLWKYNDELYHRTMPFNGDSTPMNEVNGSPIRDVITWRINFEKTGNVISIKYTQAAKYQLKNNETIVTYLKTAAKNQFPTGMQWFTPKWEDRPENQPRETPLSLRHDGQAYMVFILEEMNWHFTADHDPFEVHKGKEAFYTNPRCAWKKGSDSDVGRQPPANVDCRVASFLSNAKDDRAQNGDDLGRFVSPFNFYVSVKAAGGTRPRYLPLVIDPDVGYPGGHYPSEGP